MTRLIEDVVAVFQTKPLDLLHDPLPKICAHVALELSIVATLLQARADPRTPEFTAAVVQVLDALEPFVTKGAVTRGPG